MTVQAGAVSWVEIAGVAVAIIVGLWLLRHVLHLVASSIRCLGTLILVGLGIGLLAFLGRLVSRALGG